MVDINYVRNKIPSYIFSAADILAANGYQVYLVGGAIRDMILAREPKDYDLATNALPDQITKIFPKTIDTNAKFGTILAIVKDDNGESFDVEITTYRKEEDYIKGRWPSKVEFTTQIVEDLSRRDFTINAMALDLAKINQPAINLEDLLVDPFEGMKAIEQKKIIAVGDAKERFVEDGLRAFKACRLASELEFEIEQSTFAGILQTLDVAKMISMERIRDEFNKMLRYSIKPSIGIELLRTSGLLEIFIPELIENIGVTQPEWHTDDVYTHILKTLDLAEDSIKLAALFHDIGKARTFSKDEKGTHFYSHDIVSAQMTEVIMKRMKYSNAQIKRICSLVRWHMFYYPSADWRKSNDLIVIEKDADGGWTDAAIRRFIHNIGGEELLDDLFKLRIADATSNPKNNFDPIEIKALEKRISEVRAKDMALKVTDLDINGNDLMAIGIKQGPELSKVLGFLLDQVIENPELNSKQELSDLAVKFYFNQK